MLYAVVLFRTATRAEGGLRERFESFLEGVLGGDIKTVEAYRGPIPLDGFDNLAVRLAIASGQLGCIQSLLKLQQSKQACTIPMITLAIESGSVEALRLIAGHCSSLPMAQIAAQQSSSMMVVARHDHAKMIGYLVIGYPEVFDRDLAYALNEAIKYEATEAALAIIQGVEGLTKWCLRTALDVAKKMGNRRVIEALETRGIKPHGADVEATDWPLPRTAWASLVEECAREKFYSVALKLAQLQYQVFGFKSSEEFKPAASPAQLLFYFALLAGDKNLARAQINQIKVSAHSSLALTLAVESGNLRIVKRILSQPDVDVLARSAEALKHAMSRRHTDIFRILLQDKRMDAQSHEVFEIFELACYEGLEHFIRQFLTLPRFDPFKKISALILAMEYEHFGIAQMIVASQIGNHGKGWAKGLLEECIRQDWPQLLHTVLPYVPEDWLARDNHYMILDANSQSRESARSLLERLGRQERVRVLAIGLHFDWSVEDTMDLLTEEDRRHHSIKRMLENGDAEDGREDPLYYRLTYYVLQDEIEGVKELLKDDASNLDPGHWGNLLLQLAAVRGNLELIQWLYDHALASRMLLETRQEAQEEEHEGRSSFPVLAIALSMGHVDIFQWLLDKAAPYGPEEYHRKYLTGAISLAAYRGHPLFLEMIDEERRFEACLAATLGGQTELALQLLERIDPIDPENAEMDQMVLRAAVESGDEKVVQRLLARGQCSEEEKHTAACIAWSLDQGHLEGLLPVHGECEESDLHFRYTTESLGLPEEPELTLGRRLLKLELWEPFVLVTWDQIGQWPKLLDLDETIRWSEDAGIMKQNARLLLVALRFDQQGLVEHLKETVEPFGSALEFAIRYASSETLEILLSYEGWMGEELPWTSFLEEGLVHRQDSPGIFRILLGMFKDCLGQADWELLQVRAVELGKSSTLSLLLEYSQPSKGVIIDAAYEGDLDSLRLLMDHPEAPKLDSTDNEIVLRGGVLSRNLEATEYLLAKFRGQVNVRANNDYLFLKPVMMSQPELAVTILKAIPRTRAEQLGLLIRSLELRPLSSVIEAVLTPADLKADWVHRHLKYYFPEAYLEKLYPPSLVDWEADKFLSLFSNEDRAREHLDEKERLYLTLLFDIFEGMARLPNREALAFGVAGDRFFYEETRKALAFGHCPIGAEMGQFLGYLKQVQDFDKWGQAFDQYCARVRQAIRRLAIGSTYLVSMSSEDHSVYALVERASSATVDVKVFNLGAGLDVSKQQDTIYPVHRSMWTIWLGVGLEEFLDKALRHQPSNKFRMSDKVQPGLPKDLPQAARMKQQQSGTCSVFKYWMLAKYCLGMGQ